MCVSAERASQRVLGRVSLTLSSGTSMTAKAIRCTPLFSVTGNQERLCKFTSWLVNQADMSLTEYILTPGYSPNYNVNSGRDSTCSLDPPYSQQYGTGTRDRGISVRGVGIYDSHQHAHPRSLKQKPTENWKERWHTHRQRGYGPRGQDLLQAD